MKKMILAGLGLVTMAGMAQAADMLTPGLYEINTQILETNMPMAPQPGTSKHCITQADIDRDPESAFYQQSEAQQCDVANFDIGGGKVTMALRCAMPGGQMDMTMDGSYTATSYEMTNNMTVNMAGMAMFVRSKSTAQRIGGCAKR